MLQNIRIGKTGIGDSFPCFIVAELGVNHNKDLNLARESILKISESGADAVKIQTWKTENIILENCRMVEYQQKNTKSDDTQYQMLKKLELPYEWHEELKDYAEEQGLVFFSTMEDRESVKFLLKECKIPLIKVGSGDLTNYPLLRYTAKFGVPMILSTGMASLGDTEKALHVVQNAGNDQIVILQCTTQYPAPYDSVNLKAILTLRNAFGTLVGFSDHSKGVECAIASVALGAKYIEKHFTLDKKMPGPDHRASLEPKEFRQLVQSIRIVERAMGDGRKRQNSFEKECQQRVYRRIVAAKEILPGEVLTEHNVSFKRAETGLYASSFDLIAGLRSKHRIPTDHPITFQDVGEEKDK